MDLYERLTIAEKLERRRHININNTEFSVSNGLIVSNDTNLKPMTWDTFTHLFLLKLPNQIA